MKIAAFPLRKVWLSQPPAMGATRCWRLPRRQRAGTHHLPSTAEVLENRLLLSASNGDAGDTIDHAQHLQWSADHTFVTNQFLGDGETWDWDVDLFRLTGPAGARIQLETQPGADGTPVDTGLRLFDAFGNELDFDDDGSGVGYFSRLDHTLQQSGVFYIGVSGYPNYQYDPHTGESVTYGDVGPYRLTGSIAIDVGDSLATAWNTQIGPDPGHQPFVMDQAIGNGLATEWDVDLFRFEAAEHTQAVIALTPQPDGQSMDTMLRLFDAAGNELAANDDHNGLYSRLEYSIGESGTYYFGVSGYPRGDYDPGSPGSNGNTSGGSLGDYRVSFSLNQDPDPGQRLAHARDTGLCAEDPQFEFQETIGNGSAANRDVDLYHLVGQANTLLGVGVDPLHQTGQIETRIRVFDDLGSELAASHTIYERDGTPFSRLGYLIPDDGHYFVGISGFDNSAYDPANGSGLGAAATGAYELDITFVEDIGNTLHEARDVDFNGGRFVDMGFVGNGSWSDADVDVFRLTAAGRRALAIQLAAPDADVQLVTGIARVFDAQGREIAGSINEQGEHSDTLLTVLPTAGDYYVSVSGLGNSQFDAFDGQHRASGDTGGYRITLDITPDVGDTIASALVLTDQDRHHDELGIGDLDTDDIDMYAIDVAAGEILTAHTGPSHNSRELDTVLRLFDESGREIAFNDDSGSGSLFSRLVHTIEDAGRYYLGVSAYTNENYDPLSADHAVVAAGGRYAVDVRLRDEFNDSQPLEFTEDITVSVGGSIDESFASDIYRLTIPQTGMYTFRQDAGADSDLDSMLHIFDVDSRRRLARNDDGGGGLNSRIDLRLESGQTVLVRSHAFGDSTGEYVLGVRQAAPAADDDFGSTRATAHPLELSPGQRTRQLGHIETPFDTDLFAITVSADGMLAVGQRAAPGGSLDSFLKLLDDQGNLIVENDDSGNSRDSRIMIPVTAGQQLYLSAGAYADTTGHYAVWTELLPPAVDDVGDDPGTAHALAISDSGRASFTGQLEHQGDRDVFMVEVDASGLMIVDQRAADVASLDSLLRAFNPDGEQVAWDDDNGEGLNSRMCLAVQAGDVVFIQAGSYEDSGSGTYQFDLWIDTRRNIADDYGGTIAAIADDDPTLMSASGGSVTISAAIDLPHDTDLFAIDIDPAAPSDSAITIEQRGLWSAGAGNVLDPTLRVYNQNMQELAYNDDSGFSLDSRLTLPVAGSARLYVQAGAYGASTGRYDLILNMISDDAGDTVDDARRLQTDGSGTTRWNGAINAEFERDVLRYTAESNGRLQIGQNGVGSNPVDSFLSVYRETSTGELEFVAVNDDHGDSLDSLIEVEAKADDVLYLYAGGFADSTGDYQIHIQTVAADDIGDNLADAWQLDLDLTGTTDIAASVDAAGDRDVFVITADRHGTLTVQLDHDAPLNAHLSLLQTRNGEPMRIGSDAGDDGQLTRSVSVAAVQGQQYYVRVSGQDDSSGSYHLQVQATDESVDVGKRVPDNVFAAISDNVRGEFLQNVASGADFDGLLLATVDEFLASVTLDADSDESYLILIVDPVDFVVSDSEDRQMGYTATEGMINEMPEAQLSADSAVEVLIAPTADTSFDLQLQGVGTDYRIGAAMVSSSGVQTAQISGGSDSGTLLKGNVELALDFNASGENSVTTTAGVNVSPLRISGGDLGETGDLFDLLGLFDLAIEDLKGDDILAMAGPDDDGLRITQQQNLVASWGLPALQQIFQQIVQAVTPQNWGDLPAKWLEPLQTIIPRFEAEELEPAVDLLKSYFGWNLVDEFWELGDTLRQLIPDQGQPQDTGQDTTDNATPVPAPRPQPNKAASAAGAQAVVEVDESRLFDDAFWSATPAPFFEDVAAEQTRLNRPVATPVAMLVGSP